MENYFEDLKNLVEKINKRKENEKRKFENLNREDLLEKICEELFDRDWIFQLYKGKNQIMEVSFILSNEEIHTGDLDLEGLKDLLTEITLR